MPATVMHKRKLYVIRCAFIQQEILFLTENMNKASWESVC